MLIRGTEAASVSAEGDSLRGGGDEIERSEKYGGKVHRETRLPSVKRQRWMDGRCGRRG